MIRGPLLLQFAVVLFLLILAEGEPLFGDELVDLINIKTQILNVNKAIKYMKKQKT